MIIEQIHVVHVALIKANRLNLRVGELRVKTVGILVGVIGVTLMVSGSRKAVGPEVRLLAAGSAAGLAAVDVVYVTQGRISPVYLFNAAAEFGLLWLWRSIARRSGGRPLSLADSGERRRPRMKASPHRVDR